MKNDWYKDWFNSPYYHKLYFERNEEEAKGFVLRLIQHLNPPPNSLMLDAGCGRGRHSKVLSLLGFDVTGFDLAPNSIAIAKKSETEKLHFYIHDMRLPFWINYFDYAFSFFTSFGYFRTRREHDDAIRTIAGSLKPGAIFVLDYLNVHFVEEHLVHNETIKMGDTVFDIHRWDSETHFYKKIKIADPSLDSPLEFTEKVAKFSLGDFTEMFSYHSLQIEEVIGDYQFNSYDIKKTPRLIMIAKKKGGEPGDKKKRLYSDGRTTDALT